MDQKLPDCDAATANGPGKVECHICHYVFKHKFRSSALNQLKSHMTIHTGEKPFQCSKCGERFRRRDYLVRHSKKRNCQQIHYRKTEDSGTKETDSDNVTEIERSGNDDNVECHICHHVCRKDILKSHMRIHTGERLYECNECGARFKRSDALKIHKKSLRRCQQNIERNTFRDNTVPVQIIRKLQ